VDMPSASKKSMVALVQEHTSFVGQASLLCKVFEPAHTHGAALFVHGWGGSHLDDEDAARALAQRGIATCIFNQSPRAGPDEHDSATRLETLSELLAVYDWFVHEWATRGLQVGLVGFSYGAYLSILLSAKRNVPWLVIRSPAIYPDRRWDEPKAELLSHVDMLAFRSKIGPENANAALDSAASFQGPVLLITAEHDRQIPSAVFEAYAHALPNAPARHVVPGADHALSSPVWQKSYILALCQWVQERFEPAA
jgi:uncharacterized protein